MRSKYLREVREMCNQDYDIVNETWINAHHTLVKKMWQLPDETWIMTVTAEFV
uniref:Uncharacterized protein n=1 Tax=Arion vulgaris TaxID=1028688 RepID=A0A0B7AMN7_9EUPU